MLEEGSFRGRTADFVVMFFFGGVLMIVSFSNEKKTDINILLLHRVSKYIYTQFIIL